MAIKSKKKEKTGYKLKGPLKQISPKIKTGPSGNKVISKKKPKKKSKKA